MDIDLLNLEVYRETFRVPKGQTIVELVSFDDIQIGRKLVVFLRCDRNGRDFEIRAIYDVKSNSLDEFSFDLTVWEERHAETPVSSRNDCLTNKHRRHIRVMLSVIIDFVMGAPRVTSDMQHMIVSWVKWNWENST